MNNRSLRAQMVLAALSVPMAAFAQLADGSRAAVLPQPYTAEFKITHVQTLANGATITREIKDVIAQDSQGRRMTATTQSPGFDDRPPFTSVFVQDQVDGTQINWNSQRKQARVVKMPPADQRHGCWAAASGSSISYGDAPVHMPVPGAGGGGVGSGSASVSALGAGGFMTGSGATLATSNTRASGPIVAPRSAPMRPVREDLGTDTIMGVEVRGTRITITTPVGRIGNDQPLVRTEERWSAPSLGGLTLRDINNDPQSGKSTRELVNLDLSEPDPSTFQPPEGYEVVTEEMHQVACQTAP